MVVVLLTEKNNRGKWPLVRITKTLPHKGDGEIRRVEVRMPNGKIRERGVRYIAPLGL